MKVTAIALPSLRRPSWLTDDLGDAIGKGVRIGVIDSGWDSSRRAIQVRKGIGLVDPANEFSVKRSDDDADCLGHGTYCADIILGIAPGAEVYPIRVFGRRLETSPESIQAGLEWADANGLNLVNLSLGTWLETALKPLYRACEICRRKGMILVSAVNIARGWSYPAIFENVIGVTAGEFSNIYEFRYHRADAVECIAQGRRLIQSDGDPGKMVMGSSIAAPHITGIIAILLERHPQPDLERIRELLSKYATAR